MYNYSTKNYSKEHMAKAVGRGLPVSHKMAVEVCDFIRHKKVDEAKKILNRVMEEKQAIPFRRFNRKFGHRTKLGPARYPKKVCEEILGLIESVEANAQFKGLNTSDLVISHIKSDKAATQWHHGRQSRRKMKRINLEVMVEEKKEKPKKKEGVKKE